MLDSKVLVQGAAELVRAVESLLARRYVMVGRVAFLIDVSRADHIIPAREPRLNVLLEPVKRDESRTKLLLCREFKLIMCFCVPWRFTVSYLNRLMQLVITLILVREEIEKDRRCRRRVRQKYVLKST